VGSTRACAIVTCELVAPYPDRPNEGMFTVSSEVAPCASPSGANVSLQLVERALRESKAIDVEGLCVQAGARVWSVKLQIVLLDDCGAVADAASLAALAALLHFRRPDVTVVCALRCARMGPAADTRARAAHARAEQTGDACVVHGLDEKAPVPLAVHHVPLFITLAFMEEQQALVDPTHVEEAVARGIVALGLNGHREVCFASKTGAPMPAAALLAATQRALELRAERGDVLDAAVLAQPF